MGSKGETLPDKSQLRIGAKVVSANPLRHASKLKSMQPNNDLASWPWQICSHRQPRRHVQAEPVHALSRVLLIVVRCMTAGNARLGTEYTVTALVLRIQDSGHIHSVSDILLETGPLGQIRWRQSDG